MELKEYLGELLGERESQNLLDAVSEGKTIIISGPNGPTGKSTLCSVLKRMGVPVAERKDVYEVSVHVPLKELTPHMSDLISE